MDMLPLLILISGPPGADKSTLAHALGQRMGLMVLSMDLVKAGIAFTMMAESGGTAASVSKMGGPAGQLAFPATYELVDVCLRHGVSAIVEKAWKKGLDEPNLQRLLTRATALRVHVAASQEIALARFQDRAYRRGLANLDELSQKLSDGTLRWGDFAPLELDVPLFVTTTDDGAPVDLDAVEAFITLIYDSPGGAPGALAPQ